jgi:hypothetical protein
VKQILLIGGLVSSVLVLLAFGERKKLVQERGRHAQLQAEAATKATPSIQLPASGELPSEAQAAQRDLPRLRNEVRQLRDAVGALPRLRDERISLDKQLAQAAAKPKVAGPTPEAGFVMNDFWTFAGFGTPEATLQSFFSAVRDSDVVNVVACLSAESGGGAPTDERARRMQAGLMEGLEGFRRIAGYRIAATEAIGDDRVTLKVQAAANGATIDMRFRRIAGEWKMDMGR